MGSCLSKPKPEVKYAPAAAAAPAPVSQPITETSALCQLSPRYYMEDQACPGTLRSRPPQLPTDLLRVQDRFLSVCETNINQRHATDSLLGRADPSVLMMSAEPITAPPEPQQRKPEPRLATAGFAKPCPPYAAKSVVGQRFAMEDS